MTSLHDAPTMNPINVCVWSGPCWLFHSAHPGHRAGWFVFQEKAGVFERASVRAVLRLSCFKVQEVRRRGSAPWHHSQQSIIQLSHFSQSSLQITFLLLRVFFPLPCVGSAVWIGLPLIASPLLLLDESTIYLRPNGAWGSLWNRHAAGVAEPRIRAASVRGVEGNPTNRCTLETWCCSVLQHWWVLGTEAQPISSIAAPHKIIFMYWR